MRYEICNKTFQTCLILYSMELKLFLIMYYFHINSVKPSSFLAVF